MRIHLFCALACLATTACDDDAPGTGPDAGGGSAETAWSGGPDGHLYVYAGPLYDIDTRDGRILRRLVLDHPASGLEANADHAYFNKFDDAGTGRLWRLGLDDTEPQRLGDVSSIHFGIYGTELVGVKNASKVIRADLTTGVTTETPLPPSLACESGVISGSTLYLACMRIDAGGTAIGLVTQDLATRTNGEFVVVKPAPAQAISMASNVSVTPSGVTFMLYEGEASIGTRTAYRITGSTVGAGVPIAGGSNDLDEQATIGNVIYMMQYPENRAIAFDTASMTVVGDPIAVDSPRHLRTGGGNVWISTHGHDGMMLDAILRFDPATNATALRAFPPLEASGVDSMAYGE